MTLQDVYIILLGTIATGCIFTLVAFVHEHWEQIANHYLTDHIRYRLRIMSSNGDGHDYELGQKPLVSADEINNETSETQHIDAETYDEIMCLGENRAIARLIVENKIKLTEGVKIGTGKKSGPAYSKRSAQVQELVKSLEVQYRALTSDKQVDLRQLELKK